MSTTAKWGIIAAVALITSFTAYYSVSDPAVPNSIVTTSFRAVGLVCLFASIFLSIYFNAKSQPQTDFKKMLQEGMKTGLLAIVLYSLYNYLYLSTINPEYIDNLVKYNIDAINASASEQGIKDSQIAGVKANITPFKGVTQDLLKLLAVTSMGSFMGSILLRFWTQRFSL